MLEAKKCSFHASLPSMRLLQRQKLLQAESVARKKICGVRGMKFDEFRIVMQISWVGLS